MTYKNIDKNNSVIHCPTMSHLKIIKSFMLKNKHWNLSCNYETKYEVYFEDFCMQLNGINYSSLDYYKKNGYIIIESKDFIKDNIKSEIINDYELI